MKLTFWRGLSLTASFSGNIFIRENCVDIRRFCVLFGSLKSWLIKRHESWMKSRRIGINYQILQIQLRPDGVYFPNKVSIETAFPFCEQAGARVFNFPSTMWQLQQNSIFQPGKMDERKGSIPGHLFRLTIFLPPTGWWMQLLGRADFPDIISYRKIPSPMNNHENYAAWNQGNENINEPICTSRRSFKLKN